MKTEIESIVIVTNKYGKVATMYFTNPKYNKIVSASSKPGIHALIDKHVKKALNNE